ncbi:aerotolerance protein [Pontibacter silvestris]|uniref:Aerotolerance protein n=1 Tax=Pontibacter silvestris TaxID=2305183 RepID=A0ABW4X3E0_9BACT|nr:aerotolerance protein [Pontibacter silvestris]MCC9134977.1 aerotolerance protein [Pontibacter silvestris]
MRLLLYILFLVSLLNGGLQTISRTNRFTKEAAAAYAQQDYIKSITAYDYLLNDLEVEDDQIRLNLAHSYYRAGMLTKAQEQYRLLADNPSRYLHSVVHLQLGNIATSQNKFKHATALYKQALESDPSNESARYNFELLKKYLQLHPEQAEDVGQDKLPENQESNQEDSQQAPPPVKENLEPQPKKKPDDKGTEQEEMDKPQSDPNGQNQKSGGSSLQVPDQDGQPVEQEREGAAGRNPGDTQGQNLNSTYDQQQQTRGSSREYLPEDEQRAQTQRTRLQQMNISPERAKLLLDAMRDAELQYIQQLPKKATRKPDKSKPDW